MLCGFESLTGVDRLAYRSASDRDRQGAKASTLFEALMAHQQEYDGAADHSRQDAENGEQQIVLRERL